MRQKVAASEGFEPSIAIASAVSAITWASVIRSRRPISAHAPATIRLRPNLLNASSCGTTPLSAVSTPVRKRIIEIRWRSIAATAASSGESSSLASGSGAAAGLASGGGAGAVGAGGAATGVAAAGGGSGAVLEIRPGSLPNSAGASAGGAGSASFGGGGGGLWPGISRNARESAFASSGSGGRRNTGRWRLTRGTAESRNTAMKVAKRICGPVEGGTCRITSGERSTSETIPVTAAAMISALNTIIVIRATICGVPSGFCGPPSRSSMGKSMSRVPTPLGDIRRWRLSTRRRLYSAKLGLIRTTASSVVLVSV